jgi:hypothetical protein
MMMPDERHKMSQIAGLWKQLSDAFNTPKAGESILSRLAKPAWESTDEHVVRAWEVLTRPENLKALVEWGTGDLNPRAREYTDKAIEVCRSRSETDGEPNDAGNSRHA